MLTVEKYIIFYARIPNEKTGKTIKNILFLEYLTNRKTNNLPTHKAILFLGYKIREER